MMLTGIKVLVTGGAVRIGRCVVETLSAAGAEVAIHCNRSWKEAESVADSLRTQGYPVHVVSGDLAEAGECERVVVESAEIMGGIHALVNNASVFHKTAFSDVSREALLSEFAINIFAPIDLVQTFVKRCGESPLPTADSPWLRGKIINLLDRRIVSNETGCLPYQLSKKMLADYTRIAALELAPAFTVNAVAPGAVLPPPDNAGKTLKELAGMVPLAAECTPLHVAEAVAFLLRQDMVTGQVIFVDGGQHLLGNVH